MAILLLRGCPAYDSDRSTYRPNQVAKVVGQSWVANALLFVNYQPIESNSMEPWNSPGNAAHYEKQLPEMICPSLGNPIWSPDGFGLAQKAANPVWLGEHSMNRFRKSDNLSQSIMVGEVNAGLVPWGSLQNCRSFQWGVQADWSNANRGTVGYGSEHPGGMEMLMADGSVRTISNQIDAKLLKQLTQRDTTDMETSE